MDAHLIAGAVASVSLPALAVLWRLRYWDRATGWRPVVLGAAHAGVGLAGFIALLRLRDHDRVLLHVLAFVLLAAAMATGAMAADTAVRVAERSRRR